MDLPATYYGEINERNPVIISFERDIDVLTKLMRRVASSSSSSSSSSVSHAKGIKTLVEIWKNYKHRLPSKLYQERMLQVADFLFGIKLYHSAMWQGYALHLMQFNKGDITEITDVDHFMACFFPKGFDADQDIFVMKVRAMQGCALCIFELEKKHSVLSQEGLHKLLRVLNFIRLMMQAFHPHENLSQQLYNGSTTIYNICRYLMTMNYSAQALEYLLWASISLELSIPLMTSKYLPWIATLYCAVCQCYFDNQAAVEAEKFARRALGKINDLAELEKTEVPATRERQRAYKEASIKLATMVFKRAVFEVERRPKPGLRVKIKSTRKDKPNLNVSWPRNYTERVLMGLFDSRAAYFLGILEALWDSTISPLQTNMPEEPKLQEVIQELLSAGMSILSEDAPNKPLSAVTATSTLIELAITGENKEHITSAVRFIKLLFQYKQSEAFTELVQEMLRLLSGVEGSIYRRAELELALLDSFNNVLASERVGPNENNMSNDRHKSSPPLVSDEIVGLADILHKSVCDSATEMQPDADLLLDVVLFLWGKVKAVKKHDEIQNLQKVDNHNMWLWCLYVLCEVALTCDLATVDCMMTAEIIYTLAIHLERAAESRGQKGPACEADVDGVRSTFFTLLKSSRVELLQKVCVVVKRGLEALAKGAASLLPKDRAAIIDSAYMQKFSPLPPSSRKEEDKIIQKEIKQSATEKDSDNTDSRHVQFLLVTDLHLELTIIHHRASLKLLQENAATESDLLDQIKKNKVSEALFLIQKASLVHENNIGPRSSNLTKSLLKEASDLMEKAGVEERKHFNSTTTRTAAKDKGKGVKKEDKNPPPAPILLSCTDHSFTFAPAPYILEEQVCWYQLYGRKADSCDQKVRLGDCSLPGTGNMEPVLSCGCVLKTEGLEPNQQYVFSVAAYNYQGKLLGNTIGETTLPLLASMPASILSTWAHLAQVAFQTGQYAISKRVCRELWSHYTDPDPGSHSTQDRLASTGLCVQTLQCSSPHLCQLFLTSIFIETDINIQQGAISDRDNGPFIWDQQARLAECERMLVAMDLAMWLNDESSTVQAVVSCYCLLTPLIFHRIACEPVVQVLRKCLVVLEETSYYLKQKWTGHTLESIMHMIACITYYLSKALPVLRKQKMASVVIDCGHRLLQELYESQTDHAAMEKMSLPLKALHLKDNKTAEYELISNSPLLDASNELMKIQGKPYFVELAALLLKRAMEEGQPDLVLKLGESISELISRRDSVEGSSYSERSCSSHGPKGNEPPQSRNKPSHEDVRKKTMQKIPRSILQKVKTDGDRKTVEKLRAMLSSVALRHNKQLELRSMYSEERVWRSHLNYSMAQAHLALLHRGLDQLHGGGLQQRYSQLNPMCLSLAHSGILVQTNSQQQQSSKHGVASYPSLRDSVDARNCTNKKEVVGADEAVTKEQCKEGEGSQTEEKLIKMQEPTAVLLPESLDKAALHLQRAMVLAHRNSDWTILLCVCQTVWEANCRIKDVVQRAPQPEGPCAITADHLHTSFDPRLVVAMDLVMDMLDKVGLWSLYDRDVTEEELESSLHFTAPLDDSSQVDLRWVRTLILHTLERLHDSGKWESLAHFALLFNSYTREHYTLIVTPLLVNAQRRLLERITSAGGPAVPQPHFVRTKQATGKEVTCRSYAGSQLLSGWTPQPQSQIRKKKPGTKSVSHAADQLRDAEMQHSRSLVCVPLDVEDTLSCYHQALERKPHCLQVLQHSRSLLLLLLAYTQPGFGTQPQPPQSRNVRYSASLVGSSPAVVSTPNVQPRDLMEEDFSSPNALYSIPISPEEIPTVTAAYSIAIKYLQANSHDSLKVLALHEMGDLQFFNGNTRAARSCWRKALDCALHSSGGVKKWDGMSLGGGSLQQTLKQTGLWGCLQAAGLTAKIAQYILTSDIDQRTKYCLLSAHLFKCVLCCSLAQLEADLHYADHSIIDELLPGVDLFSEPHRVHLGTTVAALNFICHYLYDTGYYVRVLPVLALYLYIVGDVCRDLQRTVEGKILKIRALAELCLFTEAVKELVQLTRGARVLLPSGQNTFKDNLQPMKTFHSNKSLVDNAEALEELLNSDFAPKVQALYGPTLCLKVNLARIQLVLSLTKTVHGPPAPDSVEGENSKSCSEDSEHQQEEPKDLTLVPMQETLIAGRMKFLLLEEASSLLDSVTQQITSLPCSKVESFELEIQFNLLKAELNLQQGHFALSYEMAVSSLVMLQKTTDIMRESVSDLPQARAGNEQGEDCSVSQPPQEDCPRAVEAAERIGLPLWLRCRLAVIRSLSAQIPGTGAFYPGRNINDYTERVIQEGLDECLQWGDPDVQALLMLEGAKLKAQRGKTDDSLALLQEAVFLLSGRTCMPHWSSVTLAWATLLLSDLRKDDSTKLLKLTQQFLNKQLHVFGQTPVMDKGKTPSESANIYLPYFAILEQTTSRIGHILEASAIKT